MLLTEPQLKPQRERPRAQNTAFCLFTLLACNSLRLEHSLTISSLFVNPSFSVLLLYQHLNTQGPEGFRGGNISTATLLSPCEQVRKAWIHSSWELARPGYELSQSKTDRSPHQNTNNYEILEIWIYREIVHFRFSSYILFFFISTLESWIHESATLNRIQRPSFEFSLSHETGLDWLHLFWK